MTVYLLHFDQPFHHARHYTGFVESIDGLESRMTYHRTGRGSRLLAAVSQVGIGWTIARLWPDGDRNQERRLKRSGSAARYCPMCRPGLRVDDGLSKNPCEDRTGMGILTVQAPPAQEPT